MARKIHAAASGMSMPFERNLHAYGAREDFFVTFATRSLNLRRPASFLILLRQ